MYAVVVTRMLASTRALTNKQLNIRVFIQTASLKNFISTTLNEHLFTTHGDYIKITYFAVLSH